MIKRPMAKKISVIRAVAAVALTSLVGACATTPGQHPPTGTVDQSLLKRGYTPAQYNGVVFYCQSTPTPEHFHEDRCYTADQIEAMDRDAQLLKNHLMTPGTCAGWGCH